MERILNQNNIIMKKESFELKNRYSITIRTKKNGYESRITLKIIGGGSNPRITGYSKTRNESVFKLICKVKEKLIEYKKMNCLSKKVVLDIQDSILSSIKCLGICDEKILFEASSIITIFTEQNNVLNSFISNKTKNVETDLDTEMIMSTNNFKPVKSLDFRSVGLEWFKNKYELTKETLENVNPLSHRTVDGYYQVLSRQLIPYFKGNKNISIITTDDCKACILSFNGARNKESVYFVLKMIFDYAKEKNYIYFVPEISKPQKPKSRKEKEILYIETERQNIWLEKFEETKTDMSLLFEAILLEGFRPEERMWFKMGAYRF